jgi:hypothetical protein
LEGACEPGEAGESWRWCRFQARLNNPHIVACMDRFAIMAK